MSKELIRKLANKYGLTPSEVEKAVRHQFKYVAKVINKGDFDAVRLPYFGQFKPDMKRKGHLDERKNNQNASDIRARGADIQGQDG